MSFLASLASEGAIFGLVSLGIMTIFIWGKTADLTPEASFAVGAAGAWLASTTLGLSSVSLFLAGFFGGALAGSLTFAISRFGIPFLMSSLVVVGLAYSLTWNALGGPLQTIEITASPFGGIGPFMTIFLSTAVLALLAVTLWIASKSDFGLRVRAAAENPGALPDGNRWGKISALTTLGIGNGLIGLGGAMFATSSFFVEVNMGAGMLISGLGAFLLGWALLKFRPKVGFVVFAAILGALTLRSIFTLALVLGVPGEWYRGLSSLAILACLIIAGSGARNVFKELRL